MFKERHVFTVHYCAINDHITRYSRAYIQQNHINLYSQYCLLQLFYYLSSMNLGGMVTVLLEYIGLLILIFHMHVFPT